MKQFSMGTLQLAVLATLFSVATALISSSLLKSSRCKLDLVLCLDNTGSIAYLPDNSLDPASPPTNWNLILDFSEDIVKQLTISPNDNQVGLVDFGQFARIFGLNDHTSQGEVLDNIASLPFIGDTTNTTGGLFKSRTILTDPEYGPRDGASKVIVLITDGNPNVDAETVFEEAENCREAGIRVIVVGITSYADEDLMRKLAYTPDDYVFAEDFSDLRGISSLVLNDRACQPLNVPETTTPLPPTTVLTTVPATPTTTTPAPTTTTDITTTKPLPLC